MLWCTGVRCSHQSMCTGPTGRGTALRTCRVVKRFRYRWVFFLDFASSSTRAPYGGASYVQTIGRNRLDQHWGEVERETPRTSRAAVDLVARVWGRRASWTCTPAETRCTRVCVTPVRECAWGVQVRVRRERVRVVRRKHWKRRGACACACACACAGPGPGPGPGPSPGASTDASTGAGAGGAGTWRLRRSRPSDNHHPPTTNTPE